MKQWNVTLDKVHHELYEQFRRLDQESYARGYETGEREGLTMGLSLAGIAAPVLAMILQAFDNGEELSKIVAVYRVAKSESTTLSYMVTVADADDAV
jgi:hypothetical protein